MSVSLAMNDLSFYEPMRKNWFIVQFDSSFGDNGEGLTIACKTCDIPHITTQENVIERLNDKIYTPAKSEYSTITMSFYEYIRETGVDGGGNKYQSAGATLYAWQQQVHNVKTGVQGAKKAISKNVAIVQIDGSGNAARVWNLYRCWPTSVEFTNLESGTGDIQEVTLTLRFDWAEQRDAVLNITKNAGETSINQTLSEPVLNEQLPAGTTTTTTAP